MDDKGDTAGTSRMVWRLRWLDRNERFAQVRDG